MVFCMARRFGANLGYSFAWTCTAGVVIGAAKRVGFICRHTGLCFRNHALEGDL